MTRISCLAVVVVWALGIEPMLAADDAAAKPPAATQPAAAAAPAVAAADSILERDTLTNNWFGLGQALEKDGIEVALSLTQILQRNVHGGLSTHQDKGGYSGRYDLCALADLEKLAGLHGGRIVAQARGGWSNGIGETVGSLMGVNTVAIGDEPAILWRLYYEQRLLDNKVKVRVGKIDLTDSPDCFGAAGSFDTTPFTNDETAKFLNRSLFNNPSIPMPQPGLGTWVQAAPVKEWYVAAAVADADARVRETGFNTAFHGPDDFFSIYETGFLPKLPSSNGALQGGYRVGMWYDPRAKERFDGSGQKRDDVGFYTNCDQMVWKENDKKDDTQGLGVFARYGIADADVNEIKSFWSTGVQYQGLIPTRDKDVMAFGVGQSRLSREAGFGESQETSLEWYYNIALTPWLHVSPDVQYIFNPGGDSSATDAVVLGVRVKMSF
jgi:porin